MTGIRLSKIRWLAQLALVAAIGSLSSVGVAASSRPKKDAAIVEKVRTIVAGVLGVSTDQIGRDTRFGTLPRPPDDLDVVEIVLALEEGFAIAIPDAEVERAGGARADDLAALSRNLTVGKGLALVQKQLEQKGKGAGQGKDRRVVSRAEPVGPGRPNAWLSIADDLAYDSSSLHEAPVIRFLGRDCGRVCTAQLLVSLFGKAAGKRRDPVPSPRRDRLHGGKPPTHHRLGAHRSRSALGFGSDAGTRSGHECPGSGQVGANGPDHAGFGPRHFWRHADVGHLGIPHHPQVP
jgi:acyl carrier protein